MYIFYLIYSTLRRKLSVEMNSFFKKITSCILLVLLCTEHCAGEILRDFVGEVWLSQKGLRGRKWRCLACVGLCWSDHPYTAAFIYLFAQ